MWPGEEEQGKRIANLAQGGGRSALRLHVGRIGSSGIPVFRISTTNSGSKTRFAASSFPSYVIFRPVFFMENLTSPWFLNGDNLYAAIGANDQAADDRA